MIQDAIIKIVQKEDLSYEESYAVMNEIMSGQTTPTQNAAFLAALSTKSTRAETIDEISGCAAAMRDHAIKFDANGLETLEIVGTGGDGATQHQHLLHRRHCDRRCRSAGHQARQCGSLLQERRSRCAGGAGHQRQAGARQDGAGASENRGSASCTLRSTTPL